MGTHLIQIRVPEEILRRIDRYVQQGMYRSRTEVILDATRRFLERSAPSSPLELFIEKYLGGKLKPTAEASERLDRIFDKLRSDEAWSEHFGRSPEEVMRRLRSRAA